MKKVLFLIHDMGPGGAEKVLVNLVNGLDREKFDITVMAIFGGGINEQFLSPDIRYIPLHKIMPRGNIHMMKILSPQAIHKKYIKEKYDIEVAYLEGPSARIISGCQNSETKLVSWIHVEQHDVDTAARSFRSLNEMIKCYTKFDAIACVSKYVYDDFTKLVPVRNAKIIYNTVDSNKIISMSEEPVEKGVFQEGIITLCGIGTLKKSKGFDRLINIHSKLIKEGKKIRTIILGNGPEANNLRQQADDLHVSDTVVFLGYQTNPYKYIKRSDIFVCTSFAEGFSTAATEALILGIPVCTVEVSGMKEMLGDNNEYGIVTKNDESDMYIHLKSLIEDRNKLQDYKQRAEARGKKFITSETVRDTEDFLLGI